MHFSSELMSWYPVLHIFQVEDIEEISIFSYYEITIFILLRRLIPLCMHLPSSHSLTEVCVFYIYKKNNLQTSYSDNQENECVSASICALL